MLRKLNQRGFTIVETMIATVVFSLILLVITVGMITISNTYYKGITQSNTQNTASNILSDISQAIEFEGGGILDTSGNTSPTAGQAYDFCVGDQRFTYQIGWQAEPSPATPVGSAPHYQTYHALVEDEPTGGCSQSSLFAVNGTADDNTNAKDLVGPNMRLATLSVTPVSIPIGSQDQLYNIDVRVVYGNTDLLCSPSASDCNSNTIHPSDLTASDLGCKTSDGSQFCAVSEATAIVERRIQ